MCTLCSHIKLSLINYIRSRTHYLFEMREYALLVLSKYSIIFLTLDWFLHFYLCKFNSHFCHDIKANKLWSSVFLSNQWLWVWLPRQFYALLRISMILAIPISYIMEMVQERCLSLNCLLVATITHGFYPL